jgi:glutamyl-tRNA reductase
VVLDLAVPRNVDPAVADLPGVRIVDVEGVRELATRGAAGDEVARARRIVDEEADRFLAWTRTSQVDPAIRAVRERAEAVRLAETRRLAGRIATMDDRQRAAVEALTRGIVNTLLHEPTLRLRQLAAEGSAEVHADVLRDLFAPGLTDADGPGVDGPRADGPPATGAVPPTDLDTGGAGPREDRR